MPQITFKDGQIAYDVIGPTTPFAPQRGAPAAGIVFLHGIGADRAIWSEWRQDLAAQHKTVALEMPGHGQSFRPGADLDWTIDDLAEMVHAVAAEAGLSRYVLVGESMGGTVCLAAAAGRPEVAAVVTCSTAHIGGSLGHVRDWRDMMAERGLAGWSADMLEKRFMSWQTDTAHRDWFDRTQKASDAETILALADILVGLDYTSRLSDITCPVLLIHPDSSPFIPLEIAAALKAGLPKGELMVIPGARHGIACSHARPCTAAMMDFLDRRAIT
jgi:pimeloyl-ACP methyl ester carboxylesterase